MKGPIISIVFLALAAQACSPRIYPSTQTQDSVRVEYRERIVTDTAYFEVVREVLRNTTRDTSSHLENRYARSDAAITDGLLSHSLESIPQTVKVPVRVQVRDTVFIEKHSEATTTVEIRNELTKGQRRMIAGFWALLAAALAAAAWRIIQLIK